MGEDSFLDSYMEDFISAGYAQPSYSWDPYYDGSWEVEQYPDDPSWSEWDEQEFERGFNEAHARSEEEDYHRYFGYE